MRTIKVFSTKSNTLISLSSGVKTWGELKNLPEVLSVMPERCQGMIKETMVSLEHDDAVLPEGDFTLFLVPLQSKSGIDDYEKNALLDRIEYMKEDFIDLMNEISDFIEKATDPRKEEIERLKKEGKEILDKLKKIW